MTNCTMCHVRSGARRTRTPIAMLVLAMTAGSLLSHRAAAQQFLGFGGMEGRIGVANPTHAKLGWSGGLEVDLGYLRWPGLRTFAGYDYFSADVDRSVAGAPVGGSLKGNGATAGVRLDVAPTYMLTPYLLGALSWSHVSASGVSDPTVQSLLEGSYTGLTFGAGVAWRFAESHVWSAVGDVRSIRQGNVRRLAVTAGLRWQPGGRDAYLERERRRREETVAEETPRAEPIEAPAAQAAADSARAAADRARQDSIAAAARVADSLRFRGDSLEAARRAEEEGRLAAEARTDSVQRAAAAARQEAERRRQEMAIAGVRSLPGVSDVGERESGTAIVISGTAFASGSARLSTQARASLRTIAATLQAYPDRRITVNGYTDATGSETVNQRLSEQRAEAVRAALIAEGVSPQRIIAVGYGQSQPIADNATAQGRAQNRRVEIVVAHPNAPAGQ